MDESFWNVLHTKKKSDSLKNCSLKGSLGNQKWLFEGITAKCLSMFFLLSLTLNFSMHSYLVFSYAELCLKQVVELMRDKLNQKLFSF